MAKVMLVEDDNNLREIYEARLRAEGYDIVSARDGEEGLVVAKAEKPDLIIADIMMPKISGFEMLDILRNTEGLKNVKVIMLTALGQSDDQQRATSLGADRYLVKSQVTLEDIVKAAHELLGDQSGDGGSAQTPPEAPEALPTAPSAPFGGPAPPTDAPTAPNPIAVSEPPADDKPADTADSDAAADNKIEDFVAGATEEATPPPAAAAPTPATDTDNPKATDDKLIADAAQALIDSTESKDEPDKSESEPEPEKAADSDSGSGSNNVKIAHKKIIRPLDGNEPKKDINSLLAAEEAKKDDGQKQAAGNTVAPNNTSDPGSIAL